MNAVITRTLFVLVISTLLAACGGGGSNNTSTDGAPPSPDNQDGNNTPPNNLPQTVELSWNIPSERTNGDPLQLSEISGYEIYYFLEGTPPGEEEIAPINDPATTEFIMPALGPGTYYFSISTIDSSGVYSDPSNYVTATIP